MCVYIYIYTYIRVPTQRLRVVFPLSPRRGGSEQLLYSLYCMLCGTSYIDYIATRIAAIGL